MFSISIQASSAADLRSKVSQLAMSFGFAAEADAPAAEAEAAPAETTKPKTTRKKDAPAEAAATSKEAEKLTKVMGADATVVPPKEKAADKPPAQPDPIEVEVAEENAADEGDPLAEDSARPPLTYSEVSEKCMEVRGHAKLGVPGLLALTKPFNIKKLAELQEKDYAKLYADAEAALKKANAK